MKKERKKDTFIVQPYYEGGSKNLQKTIIKNLLYPSSALERQIEGTVFLKFEIDNKGTVTAARVIKSIGYGCDEEAIRLTKLLHFTVPKQPNGLKVIFHKEISIHFRLPKHQPKPITSPQQPIEFPPSHTPQYHYTIATKKNEDKPKEAPKRLFQIVVQL